MSLNTSFTCISCHAAFKNAELQREHYKNDWHRYNLKRKILSLPPVSAEEFEQKVTTQKQAVELSKQDNHIYCSVCRKPFGNENAFKNHLSSKKHKENEKKHPDFDDSSTKLEEASNLEFEEVDSDEWEDDTENPVDQNDCIFCLHHSHNFIKNLEHMTVHHSFFIPDIEYCTDVYGLLHYLGEKISEGFICIWCNEKGRTFYSAEAARKHMIDKGHCRMLFEGSALAEYSDFYDYSSSYPDADKADPEEEIAVNSLDDSNYQLILPSGAAIGHRSLMRYYKQNCNPNAVVPVSKKSKNVSKILSCYKSLGWLGANKEDVIKRARDIHHLKRMQAKLNLKLGLKNNKLQKHFRAQVNF